MRNLFIFINPNHSFNDGYNSEKMAEAQIDNCLLFEKDIMLVTNFPYEYRGVKATVVPDDLFCEVDKKASKINVIVYLLENKMLDGLTWFHDLDAFQLAPINLELKKDVGFTSYGYKSNWNTGSIFFKPESLDVFRWIKDCVYAIGEGEEEALRLLTDNNFNNINSRYEKLDSTYNVGIRGTKKVVFISEKPIKVIHFPAYKYRGCWMMYELFTPELNDILREKFISIHKP